MFFPPTVQVNESYAADGGVAVENGDDLSRSSDLCSDGRNACEVFSGWLTYGNKKSDGLLLVLMVV